MSSSDGSDEATSTTPTSQYRYEFDDETPSEAAVTAVASVTDRPIAPSAANDDGSDPLPPLFETINPEALDTILGGSTDDAGAPEVTFTYCGFSVRVRDGVVTVSDLS